MDLNSKEISPATEHCAVVANPNVDDIVDNIVGHNAPEDVQNAVLDAYDFTSSQGRPAQLWPTAAALCVTYLCQQALVTTVGPVINYINADIGPVPTYTWMVSTWSMTCAIFLSLAGPLSDTLGRRWFFIGGNLIALVGAIICSTAQSVKVVIVGMTLLGAGAASQQLALAAASEIFANKYRGYVQAIMENLAFPFSACGSLIAHKIITALNWRWVYYISIILNGFALIMVVLFYHVPVPYREFTRWQLLKRIDWIGAAIYTVGLTSLLLGISWAGGQFSWGSAAVLVPITFGLTILVGLGFWEVYGTKNPLFPPHLFKNVRGFTNVLVIILVASMPLYALLSFWPAEIGAIYTTDPVQIGLYGLPFGIGTEVGSVAAGFLLKAIGHTNWFLTGCCFVYTLFMGLYATLTPETIKPGLVFGSFAGIAIAAAQIISIVMIQFSTSDEHIGKATGLSATFRNVGGALAIAVYNSIVSSRMDAIWPGRVGDVVVPLGFPATEIASLLGALRTGNKTTIAAIPGINPEIIAAAVTATKYSYAASFRIVYYVTIGMGIISVVLAAFTRDITPLMTEHVAVNLMKDDVSPEKVLTNHA